MKNVFDNADRTHKGPAFLVTSDFDENNCGTLRIYHFSDLQLGALHDGQVHFHVTCEKMFSGGQEPERIYGEWRKMQPYNRTSPSTYIPYAFDRLDIYPTSNGSRFLALKELHPTSLHTAASKCYGEVAFICNDLKEVQALLDTLLPKMGVPAQDVEHIKTLIVKKFM